MFRKSLYLVCLLAVLAASCATPSTPTQSPSPQAYPSGSESSTPAAQPVQSYPGGQSPMAQPPVQTPGQTVPYPGSEGEHVDVAPAAGDENMARGPVFVDKGRSMVLVQESLPMQVTLILRGNLPTPCYQLRAVPAKPNEENRIDVEVYSLTPADKMCADVLQPFDVQIPLGEFPNGKYSVYVNGELISEFGK